MTLIRIFLLSLVSGLIALAERTPGPFLEPGAPFLSSALVIEKGKSAQPVRRGILLPLGERYWACFDIDLLRWAAVWQAPLGQPPLSLDSMAAISYPEGKAKAKRAPRLVGKPVFTTLPVPGGGPGNRPEAQRRPALVSDPGKSVGPFPPEAGRWLGLELRGRTPVMRYRLGDAEVAETLERTAGGLIRRVVHIAPHQKLFHLNLGGAFSHRFATPLESSPVLFQPSARARQLVFATGPSDRATLPPRQPADPAFPDTLLVTPPAPEDRGAYRVQPKAIPQGSRFIRPTDIAFLSDGTGLLTTFDGDVWRIESPEGTPSRWTRVASGLSETMALEVTDDDRIFTLGRNQITELIDENADGWIDFYRNASNAFQQTLHTRDYATSLAIGRDGSFYLAKGGIYRPGPKIDDELSGHRGTVLKIPPQGDSATVLADGLRLPYVGRRDDGAVFASDQQGHHVPSTPIHLIGKNRPFLGFAPTNFRNRPPTEPLFWFPYQANRSAAAFAQWDELFLQTSWSGRLFALETPKTGPAFAWQLPLQLDFPVLNAARHPISGRLHVVGLGISGYKPTTPNLLGLASIEETLPFPKPVSCQIRPAGIEITFDRTLREEEILLPSSPALRLFDIERSGKYGSGHFRWDDQPGEYRAQPRSFRRSEDGRRFLLEFDRLFRADILALHLTLTKGTTILPLRLFARPDHLPPPDPAALAALPDEEPRTEEGEAKRGEKLFTTYACAGCHSLDGTQLVGPSLKAVASRSQRAFLRQSIEEPNAVIAEGYPAAMPSFAGVLTPQQMADLLAYLETLR